MGDLPDPVTLRDTPLAEASLHSLNMLAQRGELFAFPSLSPGSDYSHTNALLSILGYDLKKGIPKTEELMELGLDNSASITDFKSLAPFIIPGFSGHGVGITTSAWVRGVCKCALISPLDIYSPGSSDAEILETISNLACREILKHEFVLIYVDSPLKASLRGDYDAKKKSLEIIDRHLINPIADFVWKSELLIQLAITTDLITPWHRRIPTEVSVPGILYFNQFDKEGDPEAIFTEISAMMANRNMVNPSDLIKYLSNFYIEDEEESDLPY